MGIDQTLRRGLWGIAGAIALWGLGTPAAIAHTLAPHWTDTLLSETPPTPGLILAGLALAFGLGALHALSPGHGKTMVAAYLVGSRGTPQQAIVLGLVTTLTHTAGVFTLGVFALIASRYILPEQLYPVLSLISGLTVCAVGIKLLRDRLQPTHSHPHHSHDHDHPHDPAAEQTPDNSWRSLVALGIAGGLVPCPSALVLLLGAIALHQVTYGLLLVSSFSAGLAVTLTLLGLVVIYAQQWLNQLPSAGKVLRYGPVLGAIAIVCAGISLTVYAIS